MSDRTRRVVVGGGEVMWPNSLNIAIEDLEDRLLDMLQDSDVRPYVQLVARGLDQDTLDVLSEDAGTAVIVGCDGASSSVRSWAQFGSCQAQVTNVRCG